MAKTKDDISRVRLLIDGGQAINELGKLEMEAKELAIDLKNAKKGTDEYVNASKRLKEVRSEIKLFRKELGHTGMTLGQLTRYQSELRREIRNTTTHGTADYKRLKKELLEVNAAVRQQRAELNGTQGFFAGMGKSLKGFGAMALGAVGIASIIPVIRKVTSANAEFSDSLSDVQKTTGLTEAEVDKLSEKLGTLNTRTPRSELLGLAEIAGRLGIQGTKDIEGFVRAANMINVSLGDALGDPEEVMRDLGKLTDTFGIKDAYGIEDSLLKVGSAINELGMASTANEGYMVDFAKRMSGIAPLAKITIEDILGLGATLDSLGQTSEVSTTALSKLFISMAKNAGTYAKYARMEVDDFVKLLNEDANEAFIRSLEGVKDNAAGITELTATLGDLGENGGRVVGVLGTLANNTGKLRVQQELAAKAFADGTSVAEEYKVKNENLAANLQKIQEWMTRIYVNSTIKNGIDSLVASVAKWVEVPLSETIEAERMELQKMHAQIISANISTEDRKRLINELKTTYPDYLSQIDADTVSNEGLQLAIKAVNDQLMNKIILQKQDEEIMDQSERVAEQRMDTFKREDAVREQMIAIAEKHNLTIKEGMSLQEQAYDIIAQAEGKYAGSGNAMLDNVFDPMQMLKSEVLQLGHNYRVLNSMEEENNALLDEKKKLMDRLGIVDATPTPPVVTPPKPDGDPADPFVDPEAAKKAEAEYKKLVDEFKKYQKEIADLAEQQRISQMDRDSQEIAKLESKYEPMLAKAREYHEKKLLTDKEFADMENSLLELQNQERDALIKAHSDKIKEDRQKVVDEMSMLQLSNEEKELEKVRSHYDKLLEEARKYGLQTVELEKAKDAALDAVKSERQAKERENITKGYDELINIARQGQMPVLEIEKAKQQALIDLASGYGAEKLAKEISLSKQSLENDITIAQAKEEIQRNLSATIGHAIDFIGNKSGELTAFQKILTLGQIAIDTASALSKIVPLAAEAAAGTGPAAPFVFGGYIASMAATVFGAIAKAKNALSGANTPKWSGSDGDGGGSPRDRNRPEPAAPVSSYYKGGETSDTGLGFGDRYGEFAGYVHKDEYVVPSFIRSHPYVADVLPAIEAIRKEKIRGFYKGGETSKPSKVPSTPASNPNQRLEMLMEKMIDKMDAMPTRIKAYLVDSELEEFREKRDMLKKKYVK